MLCRACPWSICVQSYTFSSHCCTILMRSAYCPRIFSVCQGFCVCYFFETKKCSWTHNILKITNRSYVPNQNNFGQAFKQMKLPKYHRFACSTALHILSGQFNAPLEPLIKSQVFDCAQSREACFRSIG